MKYIKYSILLLLLSCTTLTNHQKIKLTDGEVQSPLFTESPAPSIDSSPLNISISHASYSPQAINKKVDQIQYRSSIPLNKGKIIQAIAIDENMLLLNEKGDLTHIKNDGTKIWHTNFAESNKYGNIIYTNDVIILSTGTTRLYGINPVNGEILWKKNLKAPVHSPAVIMSQEKFGIITIDNRFYALNSINGTLHWLYQAALPNFNNINSNISLIYYKDKIILSPINQELIALDTNDGSKLWSKEIDLSMFSTLKYIPVTINNSIIISYMGKVRSFSMDSGAKEWEQYISFKDSPYVINDTMFAITTDNQLVALTHDGKLKWASTLSGNGNWYGPILINDELWVFNNKGKSYQYNPINGAKENEIAIQKNLSYLPFIINGSLYSFDKNEKLIVIGKKNV